MAIRIIYPYGIWIENANSISTREKLMILSIFFKLKKKPKICFFVISDDNMQIRLLYKNYNMQIFAKVFRFKGFYIKNKGAMGGGWALGNKNCVQTFRGLNKGFTTSD